LQNDAEHETYMREALALGEVARAAGEVPVGAIVVSGGRIIGRGHNCPIGAMDPTAHAEINALRAAARAVGNYRLPGASLYVTVEPCTMCAGALVHARIAMLVYGAPEPRAGAAGSSIDVLANPGLNHRVAVQGGVLQAECAALVQAFFRARRDESPARPV
jgi:tRNA(adenine34) deaminase